MITVEIPRKSLTDERMRLLDLVKDHEEEVTGALYVIQWILHGGKLPSEMMVLEDD